MNSRCPVCSMLPVGGRCPVHGLDVVVIKETTPRAAVAPTVPWVEVEGPVTTLPRTQAEAELQEQRARTATKHEAEVEELRARAAFWKAARLAVLVQAAGDRLNAGEEVITREDLRELAAAVARDETILATWKGGPEAALEEGGSADPETGEEYGHDRAVELAASGSEGGVEEARRRMREGMAKANAEAAAELGEQSP